MLHVYASAGDRLLHFACPADPHEGSPDDCDDVVKNWLHGALGGATLDEDGGAIFCLAVTGKPGDRYVVTEGGTPCRGALVNIFRPSPSPLDSARALADRHIVKMALETAQILSTLTGGPYKPTHARHPCTLWAGESRANAAWLLAHGRELCAEYSRRFGKVHGCAAVLDAIDLGALPDRDATPPVFCGPDDVTGATVEERYRVLLARKYAAWGDLARWTNAVRPGWA